MGNTQTVEAKSMDDYIYEYEDKKSSQKKKIDHKKIIQAKIDSLEKNKNNLSPILAPARGKLTSSFWGQAWVQNINSYQDLDLRIERGRSYLRTGAIIDMQILEQKVTALVVGSEVYNAEITFEKLSQAKYFTFKQLLSQHIHETLNLLTGDMPSDMMQAVTHPESGLFPKIDEISFSCSCLDYARVCKHIAAVLYGIGIRFDQDARLFFALRGMDMDFLIKLTQKAVQSNNRAMDAAHLQDLFGIEFEGES